MELIATLRYGKHRARLYTGCGMAFYRRLRGRWVRNPNPPTRLVQATLDAYEQFWHGEL